MTGADLDLADYRALMDKRGHNPNDFRVVASAAEPAEGELGPSRRTVSVSQTSTGTTRTYALRTWLTELDADLVGGAFPETRAAGSPA